MSTVFINRFAKLPSSREKPMDSVNEILTNISNIEKNDIVGIKLHMGEFGNIGYLRPVFVKKVVDFIKKNRAKPFLTDTTTLYDGRRSNAIDYLHTAAVNGFSMSSMGCPVIIADGLLGCNEIMYKYKNHSFGIAKTFSEIDKLIVLSHFKGHGLAGFGGALKNIGMGCCSKNGKLWQHCIAKPILDTTECTYCKKCVYFCPVNAIVDNDKIEINYDICIGCGACTVLCEKKCYTASLEKNEEFQKRIAIAAKALIDVIKTDICYINFLMDITPRCDCCSFPGLPVVDDIGILASTDPVAIDTASFHCVTEKNGKDPFFILHNIDGLIQVREAEKLGLGNQKYNLVVI